jgi:acyl-CoA synthetase (AMP-forming)/AMP-acid ligase II
MTHAADAVHQRQFGRVLGQHALFRPEHTAVVCGAYRATYRELADRVDRMVSVLRAHDVGS